MENSQSQTLTIRTKSTLAISTLTVLLQVQAQLGQPYFDTKAGVCRQIVCEKGAGLIDR